VTKLEMMHIYIATTGVKLH